MLVTVVYTIDTGESCSETLVIRNLGQIHVISSVGKFAKQSHPIKLVSLIFNVYYTSPTIILCRNMQQKLTCVRHPKLVANAQEMRSVDSYRHYHNLFPLIVQSRHILFTYPTYWKRNVITTLICCRFLFPLHKYILDLNIAWWCHTKKCFPHYWPFVWDSTGQW